MQKLFSGILRKTGLRLPNPLLTLLLQPHYWLAQWCILRELKQLAYVRAVYLVGSGAAGRLRYGVSDHDFMVVTDEIKLFGPERIQIQACFGRIRKWFPEIQPPQEVAIHTELELQSVVQQQRPYLFSVPGMSQLLWSENFQPPTFPYEELHELPLISRLWRKLLYASNSRGLSSEYYQHIFTRIHDELGSSADRLKIERNRPELPTVASTAERIDAILRFFAIPGESSWTPKAGDNRYANLLYFETTPLPDGSDTNNLATDSIIVRGSLSGWNELEKLFLSSNEKPDYVAVERTIFPLRYFPYARVLIPFSHPFTFDALSRPVAGSTVQDYRLHATACLPRIDPIFACCQLFILHRFRNSNFLRSKVDYVQNEFEELLFELWRQKDLESSFANLRFEDRR